MNSMPRRFEAIIRLTALPPPPPTPITLIFAGTAVGANAAFGPLPASWPEALILGAVVTTLAIGPNLVVLEALRTQPDVEHAELFDAKHQVEF